MLHARHLPLVLVGLTACATSPTGRKQLILFPEDQVAELGATAYAEMKEKEKATSNAALATYVNCVAGAIIAANRDKVTGAWEVTTFASDDINAFALPGQKIGIYEGMAKFADNPSQLAAVVGHEVGHVLAQHGNERMSQGTVAQGGMSLLELYEGGGETKQLIQGALGLGIDIGVMKPFSRAHESEADSIGLIMMAKAGFDPKEAVALWQKMATRGSAGPEFLSTHPSPENRARALNEQQPKATPFYAQAKKAGRAPSCQKPATI